MSIKIIKPGLYSTLVDAGRTGYRSIGVGPAGAIDSFAMNVANYIVGNNDSKAVIEMHFPAPEIAFEDAMIISITGKGLDAFVNDEKVSTWKPLRVTSGSSIRFKKNGHGARVYMAVAGGWQGSNWLNSYSTHIGIPISGHHGRILQANDVIAKLNTSGDRNPDNLHWGISANILNEVYDGNEIRCVGGPEFSSLSTESLGELLSNTFKIDNKSNRMGYRLNGPSLQLDKSLSLVSSPVDFGTIQLLPDGSLIILMADHQTTGGYPRIGFVCGADLPKLAQCSAGDSIKFKIMPFAEAESELLLRTKLNSDLKKSCLQHYQQYSDGV